MESRVVRHFLSKQGKHCLMTRRRVSKRRSHWEHCSTCASQSVYERSSSRSLASGSGVGVPKAPKPSWKGLSTPRKLALRNDWGEYSSMSSGEVSRSPPSSTPVSPRPTLVSEWLVRRSSGSSTSDSVFSLEGTRAHSSSGRVEQSESEQTLSAGEVATSASTLLFSFLTMRRETFAACSIEMSLFLSGRLSPYSGSSLGFVASSTAGARSGAPSPNPDRGPWVSRSWLVMSEVSVAVPDASVGLSPSDEVESGLKLSICAPVSSVAFVASLGRRRGSTGWPEVASLESGSASPPIPSARGANEPSWSRGRLDASSAVFVTGNASAFSSARLSTCRGPRLLRSLSEGSEPSDECAPHGESVISGSGMGSTGERVFRTTETLSVNGS